MISQRFFIRIIAYLLIIIAVLLKGVSLAETKKTPKLVKDINVYNLNLKKLQISEKKMRQLLKNTFDKISEECCEDNFEGMKRLLEIQNNIEKCLNSHDKKCFHIILFYNPKEKPVKLLLLESVDESKELLLKNSRLRYDKQLKKESTEIGKTKQEISEDYNKLKEAYNVLEKNNNNLKNRIKTMLQSYDSRIAELEKYIAELKEEYSKVYKMLPKYKQKQLQKKFKSE